MLTTQLLNWTHGFQAVLSRLLHSRSSIVESKAFFQGYSNRQNITVAQFEILFIQFLQLWSWHCARTNCKTSDGLSQVAIPLRAPNSLSKRCWSSTFHSLHSYDCSPANSQWPGHSLLHHHCRYLHSPIFPWFLSTHPIGSSRFSLHCIQVDVPTPLHRHVCSPSLHSDLTISSSRELRR